MTFSSATMTLVFSASGIRRRTHSLRRVGGVVVDLDVVGEPRVVVVHHSREVAGLLVELDLVFPGPRHGDRRAASIPLANPARHEQDGVCAERLGGAQRALGDLERLLRDARVRVVELRPASRDRVNAQADLLGHDAHLRRVVRRDDPAFDAVEAGGLDLRQFLFGGPRDERLPQFRLERQRRRGSRRSRLLPCAASPRLRPRRARAEAQAGREGGRGGDELATIDRCRHLILQDRARAAERR